MSRVEPNFVLMAEEETSSPADHLRRRALRLLRAAEEERDPRTGDRPPPAGFAAPAAIGSVRPAPARALALGVVTMPAVFIVVVMIALALFGKPASEPRASHAAAVDTLEQPVATAAAGATLASAQSAPSIAIGEDRRVSSISLDGDRVAMHVESPMGSEIVIFDFVDGRIIASTPIVTAALAADDQLASLTGAPPAGIPVVNLSVVMPSSDAPSAPALKPRSAD